MRIIARAVPAVLIAMLLGRADAASPRNEKVYQAVEANRAGALELLQEIVNIDPAPAMWKEAPKSRLCCERG
jgi:hypothetical protein